MMFSADETNFFSKDKSWSILMPKMTYLFMCFIESVNNYGIGIKFHHKGQTFVYIELMNLELLTCYQITSIRSGDYQKVVQKDKKSNRKFI